MSWLATITPQDGVIDNIFVSPSVHVVSGAVVLLSLLAATGLTARLALAGRPIDRVAQGSLIAAQVALMVQALIGIKLLDQGLGVLQLYIHYVGGLLPLGLYMAAGWVGWRDPVRRTRVVAALSLIGLVSAGMAFAIGRAYVRGEIG